MIFMSAFPFYQNRHLLFLASACEKIFSNKSESRFLLAYSTFLGLLCLQAGNRFFTY